MLKDFKKEVFAKLSSAELNITDNGDYEEEFPWVMMRLSNYSRTHYLNVNIESVSFTLDIFSTYSGEEEIIDLESTISQLMSEVAKEDPQVMGWTLKSMKIMNDNSKGPVARHGILTYQFTLTVGDNNG